MFFLLAVTLRFRDAREAHGPLWGGAPVRLEAVLQAEGALLSGDEGVALRAGETVA